MAVLFIFIDRMIFKSTLWNSLSHQPLCNMIDRQIFKRFFITFIATRIQSVYDHTLLTALGSVRRFPVVKMTSGYIAVLFIFIDQMIFKSTLWNSLTHQPLYNMIDRQTFKSFFITFSATAKLMFSAHQFKTIIYRFSFRLSKIKNMLTCLLAYF